MEGVVRFKREKNRTADDIFRQMIRPKIPSILDSGMQKMVWHNRKNHGYQNRTGALENSNSYVPTKQKGGVFEGAVIAGGKNIKSIQDYVKTHVFYRDEQRRLRVFKLKIPETISKGTPIDVDYAVHVENMGYAVIIQGIERFKKWISQILKRELHGSKLERPYTFKYTGITRDIYGGQ